MKKTPTRQLEIKDLYVSTTEGKEILHGINLTIRQWEVHAIMGQNGGGKSTLAQAIAGHPGYVITKGQILLNGVDITNMTPEEKAIEGLFLGFQHPMEVPGVNFSQFLRQAVNERAAKKGEKKISPIAFRKELERVAKLLSMNDDLTQRMLNEGFSGGEKKKLEVIQLALLKPCFAILDEPDSGLDVDALRYICDAIQTMDNNFGLLLITHYNRILHYIKPDIVHILLDGKIVKTGDYKLAQEVEKYGYNRYITN